jgi:hypothetical protein
MEGDTTAVPETAETDPTPLLMEEDEALETFHDRMELLPEVMEVGEEVKELMVGATGPLEPACWTLMATKVL